MPSSHLPSIPESPEDFTIRQPSIITISSAQSTSILNTSIASVRSNGERRLVTPEAKSGLFEDHLLPNLDPGARNSHAFNSNRSLFIFFQGTQYCEFVTNCKQ